MNNIFTWKNGEIKAQKYLKKNGYKIVGTNVLNKLAEIDIIAFKNDCYVFVEVKARQNNDFGNPAEAVDFKKQRKYKNFVKQYIVDKNLFDFDIRFDVIEILGDNLNHIENAF